MKSLRTGCTAGEIDASMPAFLSVESAACSAAEEYRSRWGARASNPLEGAQASSVGSTPASSALSRPRAVYNHLRKCQKSFAFPLQAIHNHLPLTMAIHVLMMGTLLG